MNIARLAAGSQYRISVNTPLAQPDALDTSNTNG
jgi:hypothetical protein